MFVEFCVSLCFHAAESIISGWVALKLFLASMSFLHVAFQTATLNAGKIANFAFLRLFLGVERNQKQRTGIVSRTS